MTHFLVLSKKASIFLVGGIWGYRKALLEELFNHCLKK